MSKIKKGLKLIGKYFLMYCSMLVPKNHSLVVCGAWLGERFADNSMELFLEMQKEKALRAVWITKEQKIVDQIREMGYEAYLWGTWKARKIQLRAGYAVVSNGISDLEHTFLGRCVLLDLWHGVPLKKICYDDKYEKDWDSPKQKIRDRLIGVPLGKEYYVATSETFVPIYESAFRKPKDKIFCLGQPRNDVFFRERNWEPYFPEKKIILYCPTHRKEGAEPMYISKLFDLEKLETFLEETNRYFIVKKHFYHREEVEDLKKYPRILDDTASDLDIQKLIMEAELLITDYSSIYIDYLLLDKPLLFYCYDYERYLAHDREMYFPYDEVTPGEKAKDFETLLSELKLAVSQGMDYGKEDRERVKNLFYCKQGQGMVGPVLIQWIKDRK